MTLSSSLLSAWSQDGCHGPGHHTGVQKSSMTSGRRGILFPFWYFYRERGLYWNIPSSKLPPCFYWLESCSMSTLHWKGYQRMAILLGSPVHLAQWGWGPVGHGNPDRLGTRHWVSTWEGRLKSIILCVTQIMPDAFIYLRTASLQVHASPSPLLWFWFQRLTSLT